MKAEKQLNQLRELLEEHKVDCIQLQNKDDLTPEGKGMLILINLIYEKMNW
jgi:hypothetical protein